MNPSNLGSSRLRKSHLIIICTHVVVNRSRGTPVNEPPTLPPLARNSSMIRCPSHSRHSSQSRASSSSEHVLRLLGLPDAHRGLHPTTTHSSYRCFRALCWFALDPRSIASGDNVRHSRRWVEALVGQRKQAVTPVSSRTLTSRSRFATADPLGRVRESHRGAVRAANGTRACRYSHPRIRGRPHAQP